MLRSIKFFANPSAHVNKACRTVFTASTCFEAEEIESLRKLAPKAADWAINAVCDPHVKRQFNVPSEVRADVERFAKLIGYPCLNVDEKEELASIDPKPGSSVSKLLSDVAVLEAATEMLLNSHKKLKHP